MGNPAIEEGRFGPENSELFGKITQTQLLSRLFAAIWR
nr:hypothetical protein [Kibdelosporangium sp. MJ126-NF4]CTQ96095.1 hypothetical protein [Kibdelosporangium sp. MJ126-NF4]